MTEIEYEYKTHVIGVWHSGMHYCNTLAEAELLSSNGIIWRKPTGTWELVTVE